MAKNLGQIAGLFVGSSAPTNTTLIWYDTASHVHKVYNTSLAAWTVLDQQAITAVTYSELVNRAATTGLTQGQWFKITDRSNALALAITSTKVQYADNSGALIVNDLGTSISYHITSGNLLIDDINGVYNTTTGKLVFSFAEDTPLMSDGDENVDYIMGQSKRGVNKSLKKWRMSRFLSSDSNNALSWSGGFFLNFAAKLRTFFDVDGGVISKETFDNFQQTQQQTIEQLAQNELNAIQQVGTQIAQETTPAKIYDKAFPNVPSSGTPVDIAQGDKLGVIVNKIYRWIAKFKNSDGINVGNNFSVPSGSKPVINTTDTVQSALGKTQKNINDLNQGGETIQVGTTNVVIPESDPSDITKDDTIKVAIQKLIYWVKNIKTSQIVDNAITLDKIARYGVLPTDIFRVDLHTTNFTMDGCGIGCILVQGQSNNFFVYDQYHPDNPYRIRVFYNSAFPKILAFAPVAQVIPNSNANYSIAAAFVHFNAEGITCQFIVQLSEEKYSELYTTNGYRVLKGTIEANVYNDEKTPVSYNIALQRVNILNINFSYASLNAKNYQHVILDLDMTAAES